MATYVVPQDVETDDKLLGPFSFRQFVYLMIIAGLIGIGILLFKIFAGLIIIVIPPILLLAALALPIKKDQPMETYLSAIVTYYTKPRKRLWEPGQSDTSVEITAPKVEEKVLTKGLSQEEVSRRLSFLAEVLDTEGYSINGGASSSVNSDIIADANDIVDMFDVAPSKPATTNTQPAVDPFAQYDNPQVTPILPNTTPTMPTMPSVTPVAAPARTVTEAPQYYEAPQNYSTPQTFSAPINIPTPAAPVMPQPQTPVAAPIPTPELPKNSSDDNLSNINPDEELAMQRPTIPVYKAPKPAPEAAATNPVTILPDSTPSTTPSAPTPAQEPASAQSTPQQSEKINLAFDKDLSVETIAKEANRVNEENNNEGSNSEVYISLH